MILKIQLKYDITINTMNKKYYFTYYSFVSMIYSFMERQPLVIKYYVLTIYFSYDLFTKDSCSYRTPYYIQYNLRYTNQTYSLSKIYRIYIESRLYKHRNNIESTVS